MIAYIIFTFVTKIVVKLDIKSKKNFDIGTLYVINDALEFL